ncbi:MAG: reverse transcriptase family protein [Psychroserpens sp.]|nr:reverse transcriptase family protein [Psychroserpens sp.]
MSKLPVPEEFDFTRPASWPAWKIRFQRYRTATKLDREDGSVQVSTLIYTLGKEADRVFQSFIFNNANEEHDPQNDYDTVLAKFEDYFIPKRNVIHERAKFHQTQQKQSENIEIFVRQLYEMAEHCSFSNKEESIRDQLVFGLKDKNISRKLQLEANLSLSKAIEIARNYETVNSQVQSQTQMNVDSIRHSRQGQFNTRSSSNRSRGFRGGTTMRGASTSRGVTWQGSNAARGGQWHPRSGSQDQYNLKCGKCNRCHAMSDRCPAQGKRCNACHKLNHFEVVCRSKNRYRPRPNTNRNINEIYEEAEEQFDPYEEFFLNAIDNNLSKDPWRVSVLLNSEDVNFKIDTGADVTVISKTQFEHLTKKPQLLKSQIVLNSPGGIVHCLGGFWAKIQVGKTVTKEKIYVIDSNCENLLGRKAITELHLINRIDQVYSSVFGDINSQALKCRPVKIILKEDNEPYSLSTPRRIPIPLLKKVEDELNRMKALGVIEEITEPTDWCAPMVPILKREGKIRICADFKNLNKYLKRERYVLPTMDDMLHKLSGSKLFSKVDLSSGFWQIPLDPDTAKLTTFITPFGRFFYKRLPFGISSAPEIFQRVMTEILQNSPAICYIDDTLIYSKDESSHDKHIQETLNKLRKAGIKLNKEKCEFRKEEIKFLGYVINKEGIKPDVDKVKAIQALAEPTDVSGLKNFRYGPISCSPYSLCDRSTPSTIRTA